MHHWEEDCRRKRSYDCTSEDEQQDENCPDDRSGKMPPENLRPPDLALDRLADRAPDRDDPCSVDRRHLEVLHQESVVADGSLQVLDECSLVDVASLEDDRATPDSVVAIDPQ